jgi:hypothetical protein
MSIVTEQVADAATTPATTSVDVAQPTTASINLDAIKANVTVKVAGPSESLKATVTTAPVFNYTPVLSVERAIADEENLVAQPRAHYVTKFKRGAEKNARATLDTSRTVYEASRMLDSYEFSNFCREIGYNDNSSSIRKLIAIGKVYPRFIQYADQMPSGWTAIYQITQIPADTFELMLRNGQRLDELKGKRLENLLLQTKPINNLTDSLPYNNEIDGFAFAKVFALRKLDQVDWRAIEKAIAEIQARLPLKFVVSKDLSDKIKQHRLQQYESTKKHFARQQFRPDTWDLGEEANAVMSRVQDKVVKPYN